MQHLIEMVNMVITAERNNAALDHGRLNHSDHESYAIIMEEFEESADEFNLAAQSLDGLWTHIKMDSHDSLKLETLKNLERHAMLAACEFIQVAAMAQKAMLTIQERKGVK